jgi:hypothetical protein
MRVLNTIMMEPLTNYKEYIQTAMKKYKYPLTISPIAGGM